MGDHDHSKDDGGYLGCSECRSESRDAGAESNWRDREPSCFPGSARVKTLGGDVPIGSLSQGDEVLSLREDGLLVPRIITKKLCHQPAPLLEVTFTDGGKLTATANHSVLTERGWRTIAKLRTGDCVISSESALPKIVRGIARISNAEPVYNLYTEVEHTFIVDGCIVHNFTHLRTLRTILHRMFFDTVRRPLRGEAAI